MVSLIVAIGKNNVIGIGNKLPWHYKEDLEYFKKTTMNKKKENNFNLYCLLKTQTFFLYHNFH